MKKLLLGVFCIFALASCSESNTHEVDSKTEYPMSVVKTLQDTAIVMDSKVINTEHKVYVIQKDSQNKAYVSKYIDNVDVTVAMAIFCLALGFITGLFAACFD